MRTPVESNPLIWYACIDNKILVLKSNTMYDARGYSDRIIELERKRDYRGAYELLKEALTIYPTRPFLLRTEVYLLLRLNKTKEARAKAEGRVVMKRENYVRSVCSDQWAKSGTATNYHKHVFQWKYDKTWVQVTSGRRQSCRGIN